MHGEAGRVSEARMTDPRANGGSTSQTATRLLILLDVLGDDVEDGAPPSAVKVISSLTRLEKLDFWLRNPDYLADELLTEYEAGNLGWEALNGHARRMLAGSAPALHRYPMERYLYGAYERIDDALAILKSYGQIAHRRASESGSRSRRDYYLLDPGRQTLVRMRAAIPDLQWYDLQAEAIRLIADSKVGVAARRRQYEQPEYESAPIGTVIPEITDRVRERARAVGIVLV